MRKLLLSLLFGFTSFTMIAQSETGRSPHLKLKKGIYFSFEQIRANNPALTDSFIIKERTNGNIVMWGGGKYAFELLTMDKSEFKKIRKYLIGISDGENFYISDKFTVSGWQGMTLCILSGPYIIAPIQGSAGQYTGGGLIPSMIIVGSGFLIDLNNGTSMRLSKKIIKELLKKHPDILEEYAGKGDLLKFAVEIITKINKVETME